MISSNHIEITRDAFDDIPVQLSRKAINLITTANTDSDDSSCTEGAWLAQHFSRQDPNSSDYSIKCAIKFREFTKELICEEALTILEGENPFPNSKFVPLTDFPNSNINFLLYCIGRAMHNVQDFYAHSNWIWFEGNDANGWGFIENSLRNRQYVIREMKNLDSKKDTYKYETGNVKLSAWSNIFEEAMTVTFDRTFTTKIRAEAHKTMLLTKHCKHKNLNLDSSYTKASNAFKRLYNQTGYSVAAKHAKTDTIKFWEELLANQTVGYVVKKYLTQDGSYGLNAEICKGAIDDIKDKLIVELRNKFAYEIKVKMKDIARFSQPAPDKDYVPYKPPEFIDY